MDNVLTPPESPESRERCQRCKESLTWCACEWPIPEDDDNGDDLLELRRDLKRLDEETL